MRIPQPGRALFFSGQLSSFFVALGCALLGFGLLAMPSATGEGVRAGLGACANTLIPSLFPFMALAGFLGAHPAGIWLAKPLSPLVRRVLKLPEELGSVVVLSMIGGYPVGARAVADLLRRERISPGLASRMMTFCFAGAPSFIIGAVGLGVLGSAKAGAVVYGAQVVACLLIGWWTGRGLPAGERCRLSDRPKTSFAPALVEAVTGAAGGMLNICAFVVFFSGVTTLAGQAGVWRALGSLLELLSGGRIPGAWAAPAAAGLVEVTYGVMASTCLPLAARWVVVPFLLAFGSLSVIFQVMACLRGQQVALGPFLLARVAHGLLTAAISLPLLRLLPLPAATFAGVEVTMAAANTSTLAGTVCLLGMCSILLLTAAGAGGPRAEK